MPAPKPTLGYPSRTAAVLALRERGLSTRAIGERIGIPSKTVTSLESARWRSVALPYLNLSPSAEKALKRLASRRGEGPRDVARHILSTVLDADLGDAILDGSIRLLSREARARNMTPHNLALRIVTTAIEDGLVDAILDDDDGEA